MNKFLRVAIGCISLTVLAQFSMQDSVAGREKPQVNFYGTVIDKAGNKFKAENITISGAYKQIIMYQKPPRTDMTTSHKVKIDLSEEREIQVPKELKVLKFKGRDYIELDVVSNDTRQTKNNYIIEKSRKLYFDEPFETGPREHEVSLQEIDRIIIEGWKERNEIKQPKKVAKNYSVKSYRII